MKTSTGILIGVGVLAAVGGVIYFVHRKTASSSAAAAKKAAGSSSSFLGSLGTTILSGVPALVKGAESYFSTPPSMPSSSSSIDTSSVVTDSATGDVGFDGGWVGE
jgi:hypothetical protein